MSLRFHHFHILGKLMLEREQHVDPLDLTRRALLSRRIARPIQLGARRKGLIRPLRSIRDTAKSPKRRRSERDRPERREEHDRELHPAQRQRRTHEEERLEQRWDSPREQKNPMCCGS